MNSYKERFNQDLLITKIWCEFHIHKISNFDDFRPLELSPKIDICDYNLGVESKIEEINRLNLIKAGQIDFQEDKVNAISGRVLVFYPELSLNDGMMVIESAGFIDENDCPPWGTWFHVSYDSVDDNGCALYAWIPEAFVENVTRAQEVDQYNCLVWSPMEL